VKFSPDPTWFPGFFKQGSLAETWQKTAEGKYSEIFGPRFLFRLLQLELNCGNIFGFGKIASSERQL
jgi:hypothetical protein